MAAGEPSVQRSADVNNASAPTIVPSGGPTAQALRTALWAVAVTALSNLPSILKQVTEVIQSVIQIQQFFLEHVLISAIVLGVAVVWGNVLLFRLLYRRLQHRIPTAYQVIATGGCLVLVSIVLVGNLFSLHSLLHGQIDVQRQLLSELERTQDPYGGGFRNATSAGFPDSWTTAQALKAELIGGTGNPERLKAAFAYLEGRRNNEGFEVSYSQVSKTQFIRTEATDWVALAYLQSLAHPSFWTTNERETAIARTETTLQLIVSQQDHAGGGWAPVPGYSAEQARSYATMMAVWAITEALLSPDISVNTKRELAPAFEAGVNWLIAHYKPNFGWEENPHYPLGKPFPGLTYQILFVLERAQIVPGYDSLRQLEAYKRIKRELKNIIRKAGVADQKSVPTEYIMVGDYPCAVDVLSYPWLLSALPVLTRDQDVPSRDRRYLRGLLQDEAGKIADLPHELEQAETWQVAEDLIGVSNLITSQQTHSP